MRGGQTPFWDAETRFVLYEGNTRTGPEVNATINLSVLDENETRPELIGTVEIDLRPAYNSPPNVGYDRWHKLSYQGKYAGEVFLEITFYPARPPLPSRPPIHGQQQRQYSQISKMPRQQQQVQSGIRNKHLTPELLHTFPISIPAGTNIDDSIYAGNTYRASNVSQSSCNTNASYSSISVNSSYNSNKSMASTLNSRPLPQQPYQQVVKSEPEPEPEPEPSMFVAPPRTKHNITHSKASHQAQFHQNYYIQHSHYANGKLGGLPTGIRYAPMVEPKPTRKKKSPHSVQHQQPFLTFPEVPYKTNGDLFSDQQQQQNPLHNVAARDQSQVRSPVQMQSPRLAGSFRSGGNSDLDPAVGSFFSNPLPESGSEWVTPRGSNNSTDISTGAGNVANKKLKKPITIKRKPVSDPATSAATATSQIVYSPEDYGTISPLTPGSPVILREEANRLDESTYAPQPVFINVPTRAPLPKTAAELVDPGLSGYAGEGQWNLMHDPNQEHPSTTPPGSSATPRVTIEAPVAVAASTPTPSVTGGSAARRSSTVRRKPRVPPKIPMGMSPEEFIATEYAAYDKLEEEDDGLRYINPV